MGIAILVLSVGHGLRSPIIFNFVGVIKKKTNRLSFYYNRNVIYVNKVLIFIIIICCLLNIGLPPTINFLGEIGAITIIYNFSYYFVGIIAFLVLLNGLYNMYIIINISKKSFSNLILNDFL